MAQCHIKSKNYQNITGSIMQTPQTKQSSNNDSNTPQNQPLKILIRLPNWLGDAVMSTPSLELLKAHFKEARFCLVAPKAVLEVFRGDKRIESFIIDESKKAKHRFYATYALSKQIKAEFGVPDIALTLTNHFFSAFLLWLTNARLRVGYARFLGGILLNQNVPKFRNVHQVLSYVNLAIYALDSADLGNVADLTKKANVLCLKDLANNANALESITPNLALVLAQDAIIPSEFLDIFSQNQNVKPPKIIGLNPAAAYGNAKRWLKEYFAQVAGYFASRGEVVVIFGTKSDYELGEFIAKQAIDFGQNLGQNPKSSTQNLPQNQTQNLAQNPAKNILNLCGKTDIAGLMKSISKVSVMITNDSGPMHLSCALSVPVIALFGPTEHHIAFNELKSDSPKITLFGPTKRGERNGFRTKNFILLEKNLPCAPCKKRECPLPKGEGHHKCMVDLSPSLVINEASKILNQTS